VATAAPRGDLLGVVRRELAAIDPNLVVHNTRPMREVMGLAIARERFTFLLMGLFAAVALTLATVGIYGVLAYSVGQRNREIGIRMALGADSWNVRWAVLRKGGAFAAVGISVGLLGAFALSRLMGSMLFEVSVSDPLIFVFAPVALLVVAFLAGYIPARRATRVNAIEAIRYE